MQMKIAELDTVPEQQKVEPEKTEESHRLADLLVQTLG